MSPSDEDSMNTRNISDSDSCVSTTQLPKVFGPPSKEEAERLQREANEETTRSEDLRLFLQEMKQHISQPRMQNQSSGQQQITGSVSQLSYGSQGDPKSYQPQQVQHPSARSADGQLTAKQSVFMEQDYVIDSAPDGGWGWLVVFSSFCCLILVDGISLCYSLIVSPNCPTSSIHDLEILDSSSQSNIDNPFGIIWSRKVHQVPIQLGSCVGVSEMGESLNTQSRTVLMIPGGLLVGLYLLLGPLASALSNQFDFRPIATTGGVIATIGLISSSYCKNVDSLIGTLGVVTGVGLGLIYLPAIATVGHWFRHRRPFAVGLALCGSGLGTVIGGQVIPLLVEWFTWSGALVILAAACFQCLTVIVLFRPLDIHIRIKHLQKLEKEARESRHRAAQATEQRLREERHRRRIAKLEQIAAAKAQAAAMASTARAQAVQARVAKRSHKSQQRRVIYRGSIMQRIIEEKRRQRTVSMGSLDGMVITRDNELIAAPLVFDRPPLLTPASIFRISEAVVRKIELKLSTQMMNDEEKNSQSYASCQKNDSPFNSTTPDERQRKFSVCENSSTRYSTSAGVNKFDVSRIRESLPQLVQDYVQSQASIAVQNYISKQTIAPLIDKIPQNRIRSSSNATFVATPKFSKPRRFSALMQSRDLSICATPLGSEPSAAESNMDQNYGTPSPQTPPTHLFSPSLCASESASLHRTISDNSITSSHHVGKICKQVDPEMQIAVAELIDDELRNEVQLRLRRELLRPQYKKDLFFTGSVQNLDRTSFNALPVTESGMIWAKTNHSNWDLGSRFRSHNAVAPLTPTTEKTSKIPNTADEEARCDIGDDVQAAENISISRQTTPPISNLSRNSNNPSESHSNNISITNLSADPDQSVHVVLDYDGDTGDISETRIQKTSSSYRRCCAAFYSPIGSFLGELLAPALLLSPTFIFMLLSNFLTMLGLVIPYIMIPDFAAEMNWTPREAGSIISFIGFANTIGRCLATLYIEKTWSSNYRWADCLRVNVASLVLSAISVAVVPLLRNSYRLVVVACCAFGLFSAVVVSLKSILVVELFGLDRLTNAFGHMLLLQGVASIVAAPIGGYFWDMSTASAKSFTPNNNEHFPDIQPADLSFYFAAVCLCVAGIMACPLRYLSRRESVPATYTPTAGTVYVADDYDGSVSEYFAGGLYQDGQNIESVSAAGALPLSWQQSQQLAQPRLSFAPLDSGLSGYDATNVVATNAGIAPQILSVACIPNTGVDISGDGVPPPVILNSSIPPILSPAPLPSSLFLPTEAPTCQPNLQEQNAPSDESMITTAGVPLCNLGIRNIDSSNVISQTAQVNPALWSPALPAIVSVDVKALVDDPVLEPVVEEEEEDLEVDESDIRAEKKT